MASEWALKQREIQPRVGDVVKVDTPNKWRRLSSKMAKELRMTRKSFVKAVARGKITIVKQKEQPEKTAPSDTSLA